MKKRYLVALAVVMALSFASGQELMLASFDQEPHPLFSFTVPVEQADHDGDGDREGRISATGFQTIAKLRVPRGEAEAFLAQTPILKVEVDAPRDASTGNFLIITLMVQSDATGSDLYEPIGTGKFLPWKAEDGNFEIDLRTLQTASVPVFAELASRFDAGNGTHLSLALVQQTAKGGQSVVTYDNIRLSK